MKRWPLRISPRLPAAVGRAASGGLLCLIFLTGGAITTVAVAVGLGRLFPGRPDDLLGDIRYGVGTIENREWHLWLSREWMGVFVHSELSRSIRNADYSTLTEDVPEFAPAWLRREVATRLELNAEPGPWGGIDQRRIEGIGWPSPALWRGWVQTSHMMNPIINDVYAGYPLRTRAVDSFDFYDRIVLPTRPIWPGFVIDTLFYAAIWFGLFFGFASAKRAVRRRRGRCPRCGYDLRGGVMSDKRLAMSGEEESATLKPQASRLKPSSAPGCPECGWNREAIVQFSIGSGLRRT